MGVMNLSQKKPHLPRGGAGKPQVYIEALWKMAGLPAEIGSRSQKLARRLK